MAKRYTADMLICIGGFWGSGSRELEKKLIRKGFHSIDISNYHEKRGFIDKDGLFRERAVPPKSDDDRMRLFRRLIEDFPRLSKMYPNIVIRATLHRSAPRRYLVSGARPYFDRVHLAWLSCSQEVRERRAREWISEETPRFGKKERRDEAAQSEFQDLDPSEHAVIFDTTDGVDLERFMQLLR